MPKSGQFNNKRNFTNNKNSNNKIQSFQSYNKIIIICIDRDDDIGIKGGLETPIIGKELCIKQEQVLQLKIPKILIAMQFLGQLNPMKNLR